MSPEVQTLRLAAPSCPPCGAVDSLVFRWARRWSPNFDVEHLRFCGEGVRWLRERAGFTHIRLSAVSTRYLLGYWPRWFPLPGPLKRPALTALRRTGVGRVPLSLPAGNFASIAFKE